MSRDKKDLSLTENWLAELGQAIPPSDYINDLEIYHPHSDSDDPADFARFQCITERHPLNEKDILMSSANNYGFVRAADELMKSLQFKIHPHNDTHILRAQGSQPGVNLEEWEVSPQVLIGAEGAYWIESWEIHQEITDTDENAVHRKFIDILNWTDLKNAGRAFSTKWIWEWND